MNRLKKSRQQAEFELLRERLHTLRRAVDDSEDLLDRYIGAQAALLESEERFRLLVQGVKDYAIFMLDVDGNVMSWNVGAQHIKGYRQEEIIGKHFSTFYLPEDIENGKPAYELLVAARDGKYEEEGWRRRMDGSLFWASVLITALHDDTGELHGFGKVTRDMTERKRAEEERQRLHQSELELERNSEAQRQTEFALRQREQFLSMAAHELRTPLTSLMGSAELVRRRLSNGEDNVDRLMSPVQTIIEQAERLNMLTSTFLDQARLANGTMTLERQVIDLRDAVPDVLNQFQSITKHHQLNVILTSTPIVIEMDELRLGQILYNVLHNAAKYSASNSMISVELLRDEQFGIVTVSDQGMGIPEEDIPALFDRFYRASNVAHEEITGWGIGLYVVKELVAGYGGKIEVRSSLGKGSTFILKFPLHRTGISAGTKPVAPLVVSPREDDASAAPSQ